MKKLLMLAMVLVMFAIVGCGGGSSSPWLPPLFIYRIPGGVRSLAPDCGRGHALPSGV